MINPFLIIYSISYLSAIINFGRQNFKYFLIFLIVSSPILISFVNLTDAISYLSYFNLIKNNYSLQEYRFEPIFYTLNKIFSYFADFSFLRAFLIGFGLTVKINFFKTFGKILPFTIFVYIALQFYVDSYLLRATLGSSFFLIASYYRYSNKNLLAIIFAFLSINSHYSSIATIPFLIIQNINIPNFLIFFGTLFFIFFSSISQISNLVIEKLTIYLIPILNFFGFSVNESTQSYFLSRLNSVDFGESVGLFRGSILLYGLIFIFFKIIISRDFEEEKKKLYNFVENGMLFSILFLIVFNSYPIIGDRIGRYTLSFFPIALGIIISKLNQKSKLIIIPFLSTLFLIIAFVLDRGPYSAFTDLL